MIRESIIKVLRPFRFRGKARLLSHLEPARGVKHINLFGFAVWLDTNEFSQRQIYFGAYEQQETTWVMRYLRLGNTVLDVGSNFGYYSLLAASLVGSSGHIYAVEPGPRAFNALKATIETNSINHIHLEQIAFGDRPDTLPLYESPAHHYTPTMVYHEGHGAPIMVTVTTIDEYVRRHRIDTIDLLKIDVDGFEINIVKGAERTLREGRIKAILCEFCDEWLKVAGTSASEVHDLLTTAGFRQQHLNQLNRFFVYERADTS